MIPLCEERIFKKKYMLKITPRQAAVIFLQYQLKSSSGDLKHICSEGRQVGGSSFGEWDVSLGNIYTTTPDNPAKNITVKAYRRKTYKFSVEDIYKEITNEKKRSRLSNSIR